MTAHFLHYAATTPETFWWVCKHVIKALSQVWHFVKVPFHSLLGTQGVGAVTVVAALFGSQVMTRFSDRRTRMDAAA